MYRITVTYTTAGEYYHNQHVADFESPTDLTLREIQAKWDKEDQANNAPPRNVIHMTSMPYSD